LAGVEERSALDVRFVAGFAPIVEDLGAARRLYVADLGLPLQGDDYPQTDDLEGIRHFGVWTLAGAAVACFGREEWPSDRPQPQGTIEFELASPEAVAEGAVEMEAAGHTLLHGAREEPWGQTVARVQSPDGLLIGLSYAPWMH
jgi:catechol 2,3-dioxygenase-like lactoylglutathione lyase family enzyme